MRYAKLLVLMAISAISFVACGGNSAGPSALPTAVSPTPGKAVGNTIDPTFPNTFAFVPVADMFAPASALPLWGIRGQNSSEAVRMMSFCGTGVTVPGAQENQGLRPMRKPAGPFRLIVSSEFSAEEIDLMMVTLPGIQDQLGVPLVLEVGVPAPFSKTFGVINVFKYPSHDGWGAATLHVDGGLIIAGDIFWGRQSLGVTKEVFRHELGHVVVGLCHHNEEGLMSGRWTKDGMFSITELDNIEMMRRLAPGTLYPGAGSSSFSRKGGDSYSLTFEH